VLERQTIPIVSRDSGYCPRTLKELFKQYLLQAPSFSIQSHDNAHLIIDGTYFTNDLCLVLYQDNDVKYTQLYRFSDGEHYTELKEDLENLKLIGVGIASITCDGHKALLKAIRKIYPQIIIQRCLVHIQRMSLIWLTRFPKTEAGMDLRKIVLQLNTIKDREQWGYWVVALIRWHEKYQYFLTEKSVNPETQRYWYKHKLLRRSFYQIKKALPNMFHYLDDPRIPKSTNALESFFSHLKANLNVHRGLKLNHRKSFIRWYLHFKNQSR